ncbi:MAG: endonuclease III [Bacillota bacterium]|nr:endonuclease III [Bacillota bacterium]
MKANEILDEMEKIFPHAQCELHHSSSFQLLVAVVLSAQTTDESVNKCTPALFSAYPTSKELANAPIADIENYIRRIGLYRNKARSIKELSYVLEEKFHGEVPSSYKDLMSLPGVGRKTANVVRSVAFDIPSFAVDTHVNRVSKRLGLAKPQDSVEKVEEKLKRKIDRDRWNKGHHLFIFFGRYLCHSRNPECERCPFITFCRKDKIGKISKG